VGNYDGGVKGKFISNVYECVNNPLAITAQKRSLSERNGSYPKATSYYLHIPK
jgi:hypothetical protein